MKKILCPTDFSYAAHSGIAYAAKLTQAVNGELTLLNVQSLYDYTPAEILRGKAMTFASAADRLEDQSREVSTAFRISCSSRVEPSGRKLSTVISNIGKEYDLIVMGSDGPDDIYQFFSGSNTYNALIKSETPLLLVPEGYVYRPIHEVAFAFDYLHEEKLPITRLLPLIKVLKCRLTILQLLPEGYSRTEEEYITEQQDLIRNFYGDELPIRYETVFGSDAVSGIHSWILNNDPDVLALCSVHRGLIGRLFHKSVIKHLTAYSSYPVLVFHG